MERSISAEIRIAAPDATYDGIVNYYSLVFFDNASGIKPGPFAKPSTGAAFAKMGGPSAFFYDEGSGNKVGTSWFVTALAPDLSTVRFTRYGAHGYDPRLLPMSALFTAAGSASDGPASIA